MTCALVGCQEENRSIALSNENRVAPGRDGTRTETSIALSRLMKGIAACPSWSPVNGLDLARCKAWSTLVTRAVRKRQVIALVPYLGSASAPVRSRDLCSGRSCAESAARRARAIRCVVSRSPMTARFLR